MPSLSNITRRVSGLMSSKSWNLSSSVDNSLVADQALRSSDNDDGPIDREHQLLDPEKLEIPIKHHEMFQGINKAVMEYFSGLVHSDLADYKHVQRVVMLAHKIYEEHKDNDWARDLDKCVLYIACMVHLVGDPKYHIREQGDERDHDDIIRDFLKANNCKDPRIYSQAAFVAVRVSLTREVAEPEQVKVDTEDCPTLRIVQDAVRIDDLGAIGISKCFALISTLEEYHRGAAPNPMGLHFESLQKYLELMKTDKGFALAKERLAFMEKFRKHWVEETDCVSVL